MANWFLSWMTMFCWEAAGFNGRADVALGRTINENSGKDRTALRKKTTTSHSNSVNPLKTFSTVRQNGDRSGAVASGCAMTRQLKARDDHLRWKEASATLGTTISLKESFALCFTHTLAI